jgi:hypothetical protein
MTAREEIATQLLTQRVILDLMRAADAETRALAKELFTKVGTREIGSLGDVDLGSVQLTKARESWVVADPDAFQAWVEKHRPDEIVTETRETVRSSFQKAMLDGAKAGTLYDENGEAYVPDGLVPKVGQPILTVKPSDEAKAAVMAALGDAVVPLGLAAGGELL